MKLIYTAAFIMIASAASADGHTWWDRLGLQFPYTGERHPEADYEKCSAADGGKQYKCELPDRPAPKPEKEEPECRNCEYVGI